MVIRRVSVKRFELLEVFHRAELGHVECSIWSEFYAQHVVNAYRRNYSTEQIRMLRNHCAHQQTAVASTHDREFFRTRVFLLDQVLSSGCEVIEDVLLFREI